MKAGDYRDVALEAKDSAIGVWQARYMDISRQHDDATAEVVRLAAKLRVEEKARRFFQASIEAALAIPGELRKEMAHPLWPSLNPDELLDAIEERLVKALKGE